MRIMGSRPGKGTIDVMTEDFSRFDCLEYFRDFQAGRYDPVAQLWFILPAEQLQVDDEREALVVGRAGVDGIDFCYRAGHTGIWAFYPILREWVAVAPTLKNLEDQWNNGSLRV
jgi:hypothetical protein